MQDNRRMAIKILSTAIVSPIFLNADDFIDKKSAAGSFEFKHTSKDSFNVKSHNEEVRFRVAANAFMLRPMSEIDISMNTSTVKTLKLISGAVMGVFAPGKKELITKTCTIGIRGTGIYMQEHTCDSTYICLCYGKADFMDSNDKVFESISSKHHDKPILVSSDKNNAASCKDDKSNNHADSELVALEAMCSRKVPF